MNKEDIFYISPLSDFGFKKCCIGLSRLNEVGRFFALPQKEQDRYIKENFDDVVVFKDVMNVKMQEGRAIGREEGLAEGEKQAKLATARKMLSKGYSVDIIADIIGLSESEINGLL